MNSLTCGCDGARQSMNVISKIIPQNVHKLLAELRDTEDKAEQKSIMKAIVLKGATS